MSRYIKIDECRGCPHIGHSGGYTPGGAYPLCHAISTDEVPDRKSQKSMGYQGQAAILPWKPGESVTGSGRVTKKYTGEIPDWCPLPKLGDLK